MGFSPCGMAFGVLRPPAYKASCSFFANGGLPNSIIWYFVPDDRPFYEGWHAFSPRRDDMDNASGHEPEKTARFPNPRGYYSGRDQWEHPGLHVHGDEQDFLGLSPKEKYSPYGWTNYDACADTEILWELLACGSILDDMTPPDEIELGDLLVSGDVEELLELVGPAGLALGVIVPADVVEELLAGLALGELVEGVPPGAEVMLHGLALLEVLSDIPGVEIIGDEFGLALGDLVEAVVDPVEELTMGMLFGHLVEPGPEELLSGLLVGDLVEDVVDATEELAQGLRVGNLVEIVGYPPDNSPFESFKQGLRVGNLVEETDANEELPQGLALGSIVEDVEDEIVPGATCGDAPEIAMDTDYSFDIASGPGSQWFKFPATSGTQYHVKITLNSGSGFSAAVTTGTCASPTFRFALNTLTTCDSYTPGSDTTFMVQVSPGLMGTSNYTINAGTGACP